MAGGSGTSAAGGRRAGKYNKPTRGGGKHYSRSLQPVDSDGNLISIWSANSQHGSEGSQDPDEDESSSDDQDNSGAGPSSAVITGTTENREDRKALKKARKDAALAKQRAQAVEVGDLPPSDDESDQDGHGMPANPNHSKAARKMAKGDVAEITEGIGNLKPPASRREREAAEAIAEKERYLKLQAQGKTDEAKADLARLKLIREQREAEFARRQAEKEEKEEKDKARKAETEAREAKRREAAAGPKKSNKKK
ncbi:hypothetical protein CDD82_1163 [Ophiocordyceps australis]|uniref:Casein kinase substrate phosphoprotein PP28 domain-containing protein n=1 Tax=Ophiocordyceps australis TaxID=1399860 RepID=A0A2C5ZN53_9HYPO|nr:hypothetical protein CDD82_1163 [Ophiocordyceps australis]